MEALIEKSLKDIICKNGREWNEDYAYVCDDFGFVIDGASNITGEHYSKFETDAKWYAQEFGKYLEKALKDYDKTLLEIMKEGVKTVTQKYIKLTCGAKVIDMPSACVSAFRLNKSKASLDYFVLGDSGIAFYKNGKVVDITDSILPKLDNFDIETMIRLAKEKNISVLAARKLVDNQILKKRLTKNQPNGYWIMCDDVNACDHAFMGEVKFSNVDDVLLYTDGFSQIWNTIFIHKLEDVFKLLNSGKTLEMLYQELHKEQENDPVCNKFPRFKKSDDTSAVFMKI